MNNTELEQALAASVARERLATADVLRYLREVEKRKLFVERGFSSLFVYCTKKLGYSEPEAQLRIQAMRLVRAIPEVARKMEHGTLSMSVAAQIQGVVRREKLSRERTGELVAELSGASKREAEKKLAELFPDAKPREKCRPISKDLVEIRFTVTREEAALVQQLLDRKAHTNFERKLDKLFMELVREAHKKIEGNSAQDSLPHGPDSADEAPRSRYIPAKIRRQIWKRDEGRCQYQDPLTKQRCEASHGIQIDHRKPYANGGTHHPENLRLLCGAHNRSRKN